MKKVWLNLIIVYFSLFIGSPCFANDPVKLLKERIEENKIIINRAAPYAYYDKEHSYWAVHRLQIADIEYDVQKTNSLVSPYLGIISLTAILDNSTSNYDSREACSQASSFKKVRSCTCRISYAFQENQWLKRGYEYGNDVVYGSPWGPLKLSDDFKTVKPSQEPNAFPNELLLLLK